MPQYQLDQIRLGNNLIFFAKQKYNSVCYKATNVQTKIKLSRKFMKQIKAFKVFLYFWSFLGEAF